MTTNTEKLEISYKNLETSYDEDTIFEALSFIENQLLEGSEDLDFKNRLMKFIATRKNYLLNALENSHISYDGPIISMSLDTPEILDFEVKIKAFNSTLVLKNSSILWDLLSGCIKQIRPTRMDNDFVYYKLLEPIQKICGALLSREGDILMTEEHFKFAESNWQIFGLILVPHRFYELRNLVAIFEPFPEFWSFHMKIEYYEKYLEQVEKEIAWQFLAEVLQHLENDDERRNLVDRINLIVDELVKPEKIIDNLLEFSKIHQHSLNIILSKPEIDKNHSLFLLLMQYQELMTDAVKIKFIDRINVPESQVKHLIFICLHDLAKNMPHDLSDYESLLSVMDQATTGIFQARGDIKKNLSNIQRILTYNIIPPSFLKILSEDLISASFNVAVKFIDKFLPYMNNDQKLSALMECLPHFSTPSNKNYLDGAAQLLISLFEPQSGQPLSIAFLQEIAKKHEKKLLQILKRVTTNFAQLASLIDKNTNILTFVTKAALIRDKVSLKNKKTGITLKVSRKNVLFDSFNHLRLVGLDQWKGNWTIQFSGELGVDQGGLLREWFTILTRQFFGENCRLFEETFEDSNTYMIHKNSGRILLPHYRFCGRIIAKSIIEANYLNLNFTNVFFKQVVGAPISFEDLESQDPTYYQSLVYMLNNPIEDLDLDLTFSTDEGDELLKDGRTIRVTDENKGEYATLLSQFMTTESIRPQLEAFLSGFYEIIPEDFIKIFTPDELELLICGKPTIDIDELKSKTKYRQYRESDRQIEWFWRALRSFDAEDLSKFMMFVTGSAKAPLNELGPKTRMVIYRVNVDGNRLPTSHTCVNQLNLPLYDSYENLHDQLLLAVQEGCEGFGFV